MTTEIKSYQDACKKLGITESLPEVSMLPEKHRKAVLAFFMLVIIAEALNDGWQPNWDDNNEYKYFPWFDCEKATTSGSGFASYDCTYTNAITFVGSRLCFRSSELAKYAGTTFLDLYRDYMMFF